MPPFAFIKKCSFCEKQVDDNLTTLDWELMGFCDEFCLLKYQTLICTKCARCGKDVKSIFFGKYSVRFENQIIQFCSSSCLQHHKNDHKVCPFCQQEVANSQKYFLGPVDRQIIRFCSSSCWEKYNILSKGRPPFQLKTKCFACKATGTFMEFKHNNTSQYFCGKPCFIAFTSVNKISTEKCTTCKSYFNKFIAKQHTTYHDNVEYSFCSMSCKNFYIFSNRKIAACSHCKVKKYNFDMIKKYSRTEPATYLCSINCLNLYRMALNVVNAKNAIKTNSACILPVISKVESLATTNVPIQMHYIVKDKPRPQQRNVAVMCQPINAVKSIQTTPAMNDASVQTEIEHAKEPFLLISMKDIKEDCAYLNRNNEDGRHYNIKPTSIKNYITNDKKEARIIENIIESQGNDLKTLDQPDSNMYLKYSLCITALQNWIQEFEKPTIQVKHLEIDILQLTASKLNFYLCMFVKQVRKPDGQKYAPDTIYYMCLGVQKYLFENGRFDNIFYNTYYEKFTKCLDEVAKKFSFLYNDSQFITTRVNEEHLWESNQLGAHSPHVLLNTLLFFNKKYFNLTTLDKHMQLSFNHIIKCYHSDSTISLRFYPPSQNHKRKRKVYLQQENKENPARCPVKFYDYYVSKCPENAKTGNGAYYLEPEPCQALDSTVWFSTMPLCNEELEKMLHRLEMVKAFRSR